MVLVASKTVVLLMLLMCGNVFLKSVVFDMQTINTEMLVINKAFLSNNGYNIVGGG
jgi:hypothetical protein